MKSERPKVDEKEYAEALGGALFEELYEQDEIVEDRDTVVTMNEHLWRSNPSLRGGK